MFSQHVGISVRQEKICCSIYNYYVQQLVGMYSVSIGMQSFYTPHMHSVCVCACACACACACVCVCVCVCIKRATVFRLLYVGCRDHAAAVPLA